MISLISGFIIAAAADMIRLLKHRRMYDLLIYAAIFVPTFILALLIYLNVNVPSPVQWVQHIFRDILHLSYEQ